MVNVEAQVEAATVASTGQASSLGWLDLFASRPPPTGMVTGAEWIGLFQTMLSQQMVLGDVVLPTTGDADAPPSPDDADASEHDTLTGKSIPPWPDSAGPEMASWVALLLGAQPASPHVLPVDASGNGHGEMGETGEVDALTHLTGPPPLEGRGLANALLRASKSSEQAYVTLSKLIQAREPVEIGQKLVSVKGERAQMVVPLQGAAEAIAPQPAVQNVTDPADQNTTDPGEVLVHVNQNGGKEPTPAPLSELPQPAGAPVIETDPPATTPMAEPVAKAVSPAATPTAEPVTKAVSPAATPMVKPVAKAVSPAATSVIGSIPETAPPAATLQTSGSTVVSRQAPAANPLEIAPTLPIDEMGNGHEVAQSDSPTITHAAPSRKGVATVGTPSPQAKVPSSQAKGGATLTTAELPSTGKNGEAATETATPIGPPREPANRTPQPSVNAAQPEAQEGKARTEGTEVPIEGATTNEAIPFHRTGSPQQNVEGGQKAEGGADTAVNAAPPAQGADTSPLRATIPAPPPQDGSLPTGQTLVGDLVSRIQVAVTQGVSHWRMKLNPPSLGPLDVSLSMQKETLTVHLTAATQAVRGLIEANLYELRHNLSERGLQLGDLNITVANENGSGLDFSWGEPRPWQDFLNAPRATNLPPGGEATDRPMLTHVTTRLRNAEGRIDVLV